MSRLIARLPASDTCRTTGTRLVTGTFINIGGAGVLLAEVAHFIATRPGLG